MKKMPAYIFFLLLSFFLLQPACKSEKKDRPTQPTITQARKKVPENKYSLVKPRRNVYASPGEEIQAVIEPVSQNISPDSARFILDGRLLETIPAGEFEANMIIPGDQTPGTSNLRMIVYTDNEEESHSVNIRVTSGIEPDQYSYRILKTYPHDKGAFTQGFEYHDGFIYEGTGNYGESSLRKVELETGEILKYRNLDSDLFGEGVTLINNKIYQITYRARVGFVYDENSFELIRKIYYQIKEGWGLTNNGEHILMSDGSHFIYYMDTTYFSVVKKIEVYDQEGEVDQLNELELINGVLFANRYTTEEIVMIDPETGRLLGRIDMSGILDPADRHPSIDYFNGIAYDKENDRIFVTGKYWPKVYQVKFIKQ